MNFRQHKICLSAVVLAICACSSPSGPQDFDAGHADISPVETLDVEDEGIDTGSLDADTENDADPPPEADAFDTGPDATAEDTDTAPIQPEFEAGDPPTGTGLITIGTGRLSFQPLMQGDTIRWEMGVQGGHHIWVAVEFDDELIDGIDEDTRRAILHRYRIVHQDGTLLAEATRIGGLQEWDTWTAIGLYAVLQAQRRPSRMDGDLLQYRVEVEIEDHPPIYREVWLYSECCD